MQLDESYTGTQIARMVNVHRRDEDRMLESTVNHRLKLAVVQRARERGVTEAQVLEDLNGLRAEHGLQAVRFETLTGPEDITALRKRMSAETMQTGESMFDRAFGLTKLRSGKDIDAGDRRSSHPQRVVELDGNTSNAITARAPRKRSTSGICSVTSGRSRAGSVGRVAGNRSPIWSLGGKH